MNIQGKLVNIKHKKILDVSINFSENGIESIQEIENAPQQYIMPGFVDAHIHIESSMLIPSEFARLAVVHGTVATVSDPHEIANVLGVEGVEFMIENGNKVPFKFNFGAPSCVPATTFETAGAVVSPEDVQKLLQKDEIKYLAEMMNWPGVLNHDEVVYQKLAIAKALGKPIDGHAPGLKGEMAENYIKAGISTDHECFTAEEALDKLKYGMKIIIREGSAAKNFAALIDLMNTYPDRLMFCSDDKHPDELVLGHINKLAGRAIQQGYDVFDVLQASCINPVEHYNLDVGLLEVGDPADFIVVEDLREFNVKQTYINGLLVAENGKTRINRVTESSPNNFNTGFKTVEDFFLKANTNQVHVIEALDGELVTNKLSLAAKLKEGNLISNIPADVLKLTVVNRYQDAQPAIAFIKNFGLQKGAIASSVGHDSHNIIAVGADDESICKAVNLLIEAKGGVSAFDGERELVVPLPVAGLMSGEDGYEVAKAYSAIDKMAKEMGSTLNSPFMTLSFMALLVIPSLKLSDLGLFDGNQFEFVSVFSE
ncbi:MAG: adenine deaminase [Flammeovirgaceae bacterium]